MNIKPYAISVASVEAAGFIVGMLTQSGTQLYASSINKPPLSPPGIVFPIAWTILYALMGIGLARVVLSRDSSARSMGITLFAVQLILNLAWCFIFFGAQNFVVALMDLILMLAAVIGMTIQFAKCSPTAAKLQIPYILWLCFATYLNIGVIFLNR